MKAVDERSQELFEKLPRETWHNCPTLPRIEESTMLPSGRQFFVHSPSKILKYKCSDDGAEAAMTMLAYSILGSCVPRVHSIVTFTKPAEHQGLVLTHQPGRPLVELWPSLSPCQRDMVKTKLCRLLVKMRANDDNKRPHFSYYGRPVRQPYVLFSLWTTHEHTCCTSRSKWDDSRIRALHVLDSDPDLNRAEYIAALERVQRSASGAPGWDRPVLTHADLSDRNILIQPITLEVTGFIDWERANIMPAYFEYTEAQISPSHMPEWRKEILEVLRSVLWHECNAEPGKDDLSSAKVNGGLKRYERTLAAWDAVTKVERAAMDFSNELD